MKWIEARYMLATFVSVLVIMSAMTSAIGGTAGVALYMLLFFFERCWDIGYLTDLVCAFPQFSLWDWLGWEDTRNAELD